MTDVPTLADLALRAHFGFASDKLASGTRRFLWNRHEANRKINLGFQMHRDKQIIKRKIKELTTVRLRIG